jgi:mannose-6-phosphate isomerase-like protein (cupin superfamily)
MKRNSFLRSSLFVFLAGTMPVKFVMANYHRIKKGVKVNKGSDRFDAAITLMEGDTFFTKIATADTDGDMFAFESTRMVNGGPPLHYHYTQDEWFYILEGSFTFRIGDEMFEAKAGDSLFGPRMVPHAFTKTNGGIARMLIIFQPAGKMELHFKEVSQGLYKNMSEKEKDAIRQEHGFKVMGPALGHEK